MPSLRWKCRSTLPSHTTITAAVKCLPVCYFSTGLGIIQASFWRGITERSYLARNIFRRRVVGDEEKS
jgi:hypothetical protein